MRARKTRPRVSREMVRVCERAALLTAKLETAESKGDTLDAWTKQAIDDTRSRLAAIEARLLVIEDVLKLDEDPKKEKP